MSAIGGNDDAEGLAYDGRDIWLSNATTEQVFRIFVPVPGTPLLLLLAVSMLIYRVRNRALVAHRLAWEGAPRR